MFFFTIKDKLSTTSLCFFYALENHFTFPCTLYMIYCLNCFSFSPWLLSFIEILYLPCLCYHTMIPVLCALHIVKIKFEGEHVTSKIICLLSLPYSERAGVKLGEVDTL